MSGLLSYISNLAMVTIDRTGYAGVFVLSALESAAIPIPSEVVVPFSGFLAVSGRFSFWTVVFVTTAANLVGSLIIFFIAKNGGRWILEHYGKYFLIHHDDLENGDKWFKRYGTKAVFWGRILPGIRTFISLGAGIAEMDLHKFVIYTFLGALPWNFALTLVGYKAGKNWAVLHEYFRRIDIFIVLLVGVGVAWYVWRHIRSNLKFKNQNAK